MDKQLNEVMSHDKIRQSLDQLRVFIETELTGKKETIREQVKEIDNLKEIAQQKDQLIISLKKNLGECQDTAEGNRQLINKLLGDISRLQNDIDWYKRTYEKRSLLGIFKDKLKYHINK